MFLSMSVGAAFGGTDPEQERDPPPTPTPVTFPSHEEYENITWDEETPPPNFQSLFTRILKPADISQRHTQALNINVLSPCSINELVPLAVDETSYVPPLSPADSMNVASYTDAIKSDPVVARKRKDFGDRITELRVDNDLAYRTITRSVAVGVKPPRLAYMRKFWEGLENMAQYWDCSLDQYYTSTDPDERGENCAKRQRLETETSNGDNSIARCEAGMKCTLPILQNGHPGEKDTAHLGLDQPADHHPDSSISPSVRADESSRKTRSTGASPEPSLRIRYKGRRTGTGRAIPDQFRSEAVRAFVEGTIWPFQSTLSSPRVMPLVQFNKLNLPVRQTAAVYRMPRDKIRARQGWLEGPILNVQVRAETDFHDDNGDQLHDKARLDFMREVAGLFQLAQERRREGKTEVKSGEGKWWTTRPRWGGGPGGEVENETGNSDIIAAAEEIMVPAKDKSVKREKDGSRSRKRRTPIMLWKELKCGNGRWDPKTEYTAIGKDSASNYDEVFLVSSLNHHISIVKMTLHVAYVDYTISSALPQPLPEDPDWCRPKLQRSHWFDLFDKDQRIEAFRGLWAVMAYLTRDPTP